MITFWQIAPAIVFVAVFQISLQVKYIRECLSNPRLDNRMRTIWIAVIILFHLIGIIAYLIAFHKKTRIKIPGNMSQRLDRNIEDSLFLGLMVAFEFYSFAILKSNPGNTTVSLLLVAAFLLLIGIHYWPKHRFRAFRGALPYLLVSVLVIQEYISISSEYGFIVLIALAIVIIEFNMRYMYIYFWIPLILYQGVLLLKLSTLMGPLEQDYVIGFIISNTITYCFVAATFYFAKRQLIQNNHLNYLMSELRSKTKELEKAGIARERNRIAREIHDTLGHSLTGAIIQLEVAKKLLHKDPEKAENAIDRTQEITRKGFSDVKRAIKALDPSGIENLTLREALDQIIEESGGNHKLRIVDDISIPENLGNEIKVPVYRIVQELITNCVRHGKADRMDITIDHGSDMLRIECSDNGAGCSEIKEGNGLKGIRERVLQLGGQTYFSSEKGHGFNTLIMIPVKKA